MKRYLKIVHAADLQLQIVNHGAGRDRHDEYKIGCTKFANVVAEQRPDILLLPGDLFEVHNPNADELKMFAELLHACLPHCTRIIVIDGNHDLKQRNSLILERSERRLQVSPIQSTIRSINNPKISYYDQTGFHNDDAFPITWAVWSHKYKFSSTKDSPLPYSPYEGGNRPTVDNHKNVIELFHDPVMGCKSFDGNADPVFTDYGITLKSFGSNTIIAGDIHAPSITWFGPENKRLFTYSSSLVQRNFGEGNMYNNEKLFVNGNNQHGYNIIMFDTEEDRATECTFHLLENPVSRHTIRLSKDFNYDKVPMLGITETAFNHIKVIVQGNVQSFMTNEEAIITHLTSKYDCKLTIEYAQNAFDVEVDESLIDSVESIADKTTILKIADKYIEDVVDKTSTIAPEYKEQAITMIKKNLHTELEKVELLNDKLNFKLLSANISNFMSFSTDVEIQFGGAPITKIGGTNGVGKTTIFSFVLWMLTDLISEYQTARNKKYNHSLYFNDSSDLDEVNGTLTFTKNNDLHTLRKKLTRSRKKNGEVSGYTMELELTSNALTSTDTDEILEYISAELFTFKELNRSMFINQKTLTDLIKTSTADLNKTILQNIGIDFFDDMLAEYDELRSTQMERVEKPSNTVEELVTAKALNGTEIKTKEDSISALDSAKTEANKAVEIQQSSIEKLTRSLHNVESLERFDKDIELNIDQRQENKGLNLADTETITEVQAKVNAADEATIKAEINAQKLVVSQASNAIELTTAEQTANISAVESAKDNVKNVAAIVKGELNSSVTSIESSIQQNDNEKLKLSTKLSENLSTYKAEIDNTIATKVKAKSEPKEKLQTYEVTLQSLREVNTNKLHGNKLTQQKIDTNIERIETLSNSTTCPTCSQPLSEEKRTKIQERISDLQSENKTYEEDITASKVIIDENIVKTAEVIKLRDQVNDEIATIDNEIQELIEAKSSAISGTIRPELYNAAKVINESIEACTTKGNELEATLTKAKTELVENVKSDQRVVDSMNKYKELNAKTVDLETKLTEQRATLATEETKLTGISSKLQDVDALREQIKELEATITKRKTENVVLLEKYKVLNELRPKAIEDAETNEKIDKQKVFLETLKADYEATAKQLTDARYDLVTLQNTEKEFDKKIESARHYKLVDSTLKLYKKLLGTNGLPQYIFAHTIPIINKHLNELLEDVDFRLQFDQEDLILRFYDVKKNTQRPVVFISGMEESFSSLALIDVMRRLNNAKQIRELFIDEISGKLNDGKQLTYEARNYQSLLIKFIKKLSAHSNIYIIDHVLNFTDAKHIEVRPSSTGSVVRMS